MKYLLNKFIMLAELRGRQTVQLMLYSILDTGQARKAAGNRFENSLIW
jgi:hypothetical protein